jgi:L-seryl-tRNA(Ser) seleniumtransferase
MNDLGSGTLVDLTRYQRTRKPSVREAVGQGAGVLTFSQRQAARRPQPGFIVGARDLVRAIKANPMKCALWIDKVRLAAIEATLKLYLDPERLPTLRVLARPKAEIASLAEQLSAPQLATLAPAFAVEARDRLSQVGSGAARRHDPERRASYPPGRGGRRGIAAPRRCVPVPYPSRDRARGRRRARV